MQLPIVEKQQVSRNNQRYISEAGEQLKQGFTVCSGRDEAETGRSQTRGLRPDKKKDDKLMKRSSKIIKWWFIPLAAICLLNSCDDYKVQTGRLAVASAGTKTLYFDEIPAMAALTLSKEDSVAAINSYINKWAKRELLKIKAENNLSDEFKREVEKQLEKIRADLLIHQYEQQMLLQRLDTVVSMNEIEQFYNDNIRLFNLNYNIVKALFIKIPSDIPDIERVRQWYRSDNQDDIMQLESFCYQYADKYDDFGERWIRFSVVTDQLPGTIGNREQFLRGNRYIERSDSLYNYFVSLRDYSIRGSTAPLEYIQGAARDVILNRRKKEFLKELENGVFNEAVREGMLTIY